MAAPRIEHETVIRQLDQQLEYIQQVDRSLFGDAICLLSKTQGLHQHAIKIPVDIQGALFSHSKSIFRKCLRVVSAPPSATIRVVCEQSHAVSEPSAFVDIPKKSFLRLLEEIDARSEGFVGMIEIVSTLQIHAMVVVVDAPKICL